MRRPAVVLLLLMFTAAGCRSTLVRTGTVTTATPEPSVSYGKALASAVPAPTAAPAVANTGIVVRLIDQNGLHPAAIPIEITGPVRETAYTDAAGTVRLSPAHEGAYKVRVVPGCTSQVDVRGGGFASFGLNTGETKTKELPVQWMHRYGPSPPIFTNPASSWPVGRKVDVRYDVSDRCGPARAPNASLSTYRFTTSSNLTVIGVPVLRSDKDAHAHVTVECTKSGPVSLVLVDRTNPSDRLDLAHDVVGYGPSPSCS